MKSPLFTRIATIGTLLAMLLLGTACSGGADVSRSDLQGVCTGGVVEGAPAYEGAGDVAVFFRANADKAFQLYTPLSGRSLDEWMVTDDYENAALVVCLTGVEEIQVLSCEYTGDDDRQATIEYYDMRYQVELYAAQSGELVASTEFTAQVNPRDNCPDRYAFQSDADVVAVRADPKQNSNTNDLLAEFVAAYIK